MEKHLIIVGGQGRCGSSLVMQMLVAGGIESTGGTYPFWEDPRATRLPFDAEWLSESRGKCVKILQANRMPPPAGLDARVIWMQRSLNQQIKSWKKLGRERLGFVKQPNIKELRRRIQQTRPWAREALRLAASEGGMMNLRFEDVIKDPHKSAQRIAKHILMPVDVDAMAAVVRKRDISAQKKLLETTLIKEAVEQADG